MEKIKGIEKGALKIKEVTIKGISGNQKKVTYEGRVKDELGYIPYSVWNLTKDQKLMKLVNDAGDIRYTDEGDALSELNPSTVKRCLDIWSKKGDLVLDPFLNRGSTSILSAYFGRIGYGNDIVPEYVRSVINQREYLKKLYKWAENIHISLGDARDIDRILETIFKIKEVDYIITSPPFWNVEKYLSTDGQMSDISDYEYFLKEYEWIIIKLYKILKIEKFVTFIVNDFRRGGKYFWFSGDTIQIFLRNGFELHDIVINVVRTPHVSGVGDAVLVQKRTLKYHEYVLTFKKT